PVTAFIDTATLFMLAGQQEFYGRVRLGGSLGYGLAGLAVGLIVAGYGLNAALWLGAALLVLTLVTVQRLDFAPALPEAATAPGRPGALLRDRSWPPFLVLAFAGGVFTVISTSYFLPYLKELGAPDAALGLPLAIGVMTEIPLLFFGNRLLTRFPAYGLF